MTLGYAGASHLGFGFLCLGFAELGFVRFYRLAV